MKVRSSMRPQKALSCVKPRVLVHNMHRSSVVGRRLATIGKPETEKKKTHTDLVYFTYIMLDATPGPMAMTFCTLGDIVIIINRSIFGSDRSTDFRSVKGRKRPFCILKWDCS